MISRNVIKMADMNKAIDASVAYAGVSAQLLGISIGCTEGFFIVRLETQWLSYELYVDTESFEVTGMNYEPVEPPAIIA